MTSTATIANSSVLITGANRGLGQALVEEALRRGAKRVYAGARQPQTHPSHRVRSLALDITQPAEIQAAVQEIDSLDLLINNAGVSVPDDLDGRDALERHLAVNLYGTWEVTHAFLPREIFPDPMSAALAAGWYAGGAKALERQNAELVRPDRVAA